MSVEKNERRGEKRREEEQRKIMGSDSGRLRAKRSQEARQNYMRKTEALDSYFTRTT